MAARKHIAGLDPAENRALNLLVSLCLGAVVLSAFLVIHSSHACRGLYAELQALEADQWFLQEDYSRLLLEESTWASHHRVEKVATDELDMHSPRMQELKVVTP
ncbi:cell division protein FtsL [Parahaliea aestuarii]|uniref:Cell division protein FtsL n=1 Tax=Parahaliea aestuarii TaxID=1852021 RepID=A0A5C9A5Q0_9GAMM|nr:cell division protein FtsL [Parahaliea aestuarii]TXS94937.1 cell division protein FtsL [Parahaliea aestuarii]